MALKSVYNYDHSCVRMSPKMSLFWEVICACWGHSSTTLLDYFSTVTFTSGWDFEGHLIETLGSLWVFLTMHSPEHTSLCCSSNAYQSFTNSLYECNFLMCILSALFILPFSLTGITGSLSCDIEILLLIPVNTLSEIQTVYCEFWLRSSQHSLCSWGFWGSAKPNRILKSAPVEHSRELQSHSATCYLLIKVYAIYFA